MFGSMLMGYKGADFVVELSCFLFFLYSISVLYSLGIGTWDMGGRGRMVVDGQGSKYSFAGRNRRRLCY